MFRASETSKMLFVKSILRVKSQVGPTEAVLIRELFPQVFVSRAAFQCGS